MAGRCEAAPGREEAGFGCQPCRQNRNWTCSRGQGLQPARNISRQSHRYELASTDETEWTSGRHASLGGLTVAMQGLKNSKCYELSGSMEQGGIFCGVRERQDQYSLLRGTLPQSSTKCFLFVFVFLR